MVHQHIQLNNPENDEENNPMNDKKYQFSTLIDKELHTKVKIHAIKNRITMSELTEQAFKLYLYTHTEK